MAGFGHHHHQSNDDDPLLAARNSRRGLGLFAIYLVFYTGFVGLNAFWRSIMSIRFGGINLAVWYGFGLIFGALLLALIYAWWCRSPEEEESEVGQ